MNIKVGKKIVLKDSDEFFFTGFNPGDVFEIIDIKNVLNDNIVSIISANNKDVVYFWSEIVIQNFFTEYIPDNNNTKENTSNNKCELCDSKIRLQIVPDTTIADVLDNARIKVFKAFGKCTIVAVRLINGFMLVESSYVPCDKNYNEVIGIENCLEKIIRRVLELEAYCQYEFIENIFNSNELCDMYSFHDNEGTEIKCSIAEDGSIEWKIDLEKAMK